MNRNIRVVSLMARRMVSYNRDEVPSCRCWPNSTCHLKESGSCDHSLISERAVPGAFGKPSFLNTTQMDTTRAFRENSTGSSVSIDHTSKH